MMPRRKSLTTAEILMDIQKRRIAYGADEGARYVEHVEDHEHGDARSSWIDRYRSKF